MTPSQAIFTSMVRDGLRRAYRVAEAIERKHDTIVDVMLVDQEGRLGAGDPDSIHDVEVRFIFQASADAEDVVVSVDETFGRMFETVDNLFTTVEAS